MEKIDLSCKNEKELESRWDFETDLFSPYKTIFATLPYFLK